MTEPLPKPITGYQIIEPPREDEDEKPAKFDWAALLALIAIFAIIGVFGLIMSTTTSEEIKNVTVIEKYPAEYRGPAENIIDENGIQYYFTKTQLWAKMRLNETYEVRSHTTRGDHTPTIDAIHINEVWYY
jgi:hypothetical protein